MNRPDSSHSRRRRHTEPFGRLGRQASLTGIWPGSPSRRWGIELTEGQPDTSANKANEKKTRTMKKVIAVAGLGAALVVAPLAVAGTANADSDVFVDELNAHGWYDAYPGSLLNQGYHVCWFLNSGYSVASVVNDTYYRTDYSVGTADAYEFVALADDYLC